jgi:hypothetical protein
VGDKERKKNYLPFKYHIGESPRYWNKEKGRAKQSGAFRQYPEFNARLRAIEDTVLSVLRGLVNDGSTITRELLKIRIDEVLKPNRNKGRNKLMQFIPEFIDLSDRSAGTKKSYKRVFADLQEYETEKNKRLMFDRIGIDFHDSFV